jgi:hypothetical protein
MPGEYAKTVTRFSQQELRKILDIVEPPACLLDVDPSLVRNPIERLQY